MSFIGLRPGLPAEVAQYGARDKRRLAVKPGCGGAWQVGPEAIRLSRRWSISTYGSPLRLIRSLDLVALGMFLDRWESVVGGHVMRVRTGSGLRHRFEMR